MWSRLEECHRGARIVLRAEAAERNGPVMDPDTTSPCYELVPSQWLDRMLPCFTDVPERRLLVAVLMDAVRCLQLVGRPRTEVVSWMRGERAARISFQSLCEDLGLQAASLGPRLLRPVIVGCKPQRRVRVQAHSAHVRIVRGTVMVAPLPEVA